MKYCTVAKARSHLEKTEKKTHGNKKEYLPVRPCTNSKKKRRNWKREKKRETIINWCKNVLESLLSAGSGSKRLICYFVHIPMLNGHLLHKIH